ncbi:hypothetical protein M0R45_030249 [Rubus argutus]|uniref:Uncharacterized protein n=1 Tax=Rubus argutus TaxID=59490 RepID=A0AAW1WEP2_RUBAR
MVIREGHGWIGCSVGGAGSDGLGAGQQLGENGVDRAAARAGQHGFGEQRRRKEEARQGQRWRHGGVNGCCRQRRKEEKKEEKEEKREKKKRNGKKVRKKEKKSKSEKRSDRPSEKRVQSHGL